MKYYSFPENVPNEPGMYILVCKLKSVDSECIYTHVLCNLNTDNNWGIDYPNVVAVSDKIDKYKE